MNLIVRFLIACFALSFILSCASHSKLTSREPSSSGPIALTKNETYNYDRIGTRHLVGMEFLKFAIEMKTDAGNVINGIRLSVWSRTKPGLAEFGFIDDAGIFTPSGHQTEYDYTENGLNSAGLVIGKVKVFIRIETDLRRAWMDGPGLVTSKGQILSPGTGYFRVEGRSRR